MSFLTYAKCSPYHPQANAQTERFNLTLKNAWKSQLDAENWAHRLPMVLLALRTLHREEFDASSAMRLYGMNLRLPNQFYPTPNEWQTDPKPHCNDSNEWHLISMCPQVSQLTKMCMSINVCSRVLTSWCLTNTKSIPWTRLGLALTPLIGKAKSTQSASIAYGPLICCQTL